MLFRLMSPLEKLYRSIIVRRRAAAGNKKSELDIISVGNITAGGTGKTEVVFYLAEKLVRQGVKTAILTKGYKGSENKGQVAVASAKLYGDEPVMLYSRLGGKVPILKFTKKYKALPILYSRYSDYTILVDDGFQHFKLPRKKDIVCVNALNPFGNGHLLPRGILREPISHLKYADECYITNANLVPSDELRGVISKTKTFCKKTVLFGYTFSGFFNESGKAKMPKNASVFLFAGIGNPAGFIRIVRINGYKIKGTKFFRDHHFFTKHDILQVQEQARNVGVEYIVTTEKDFVRIKQTAGIFYLKIKGGVLDEVI